ncbi:MAG TPA: alkaline phosphatase family protein, partial [Fimbriimonadaceae bacterium]|nr:alkaline phosphatase family protein [Fimbriimonadaceae bacterium]
IFTGAWGDANGITGNGVPMMPPGQHSLLQTRSGFSSESLTAEPMYVTAARAGKKVVVLSATQSYPPEPHLASLGAARSNFTSFSGFEHPIAPNVMHEPKDLDVPKGSWTSLPVREGPWRESTFKIGEENFYVLLYQDRQDPAPGYDTALIRQGSREAAKAKASAVLKPGRARDDTSLWSRPFRLEQRDLFANTFFRLFELDPEGKSLKLFQRGANGLKGAANKDQTELYLKAYAGFHADPFWSYQDGMLGPQLYQGGDGEAERRLLEMVRLDCHFLREGTKFALRTWRPDLLTHYTPMSDSAGHTWMGVLDPDSPSHSPTLAARLWPFYAEVYRLQDEWLGDILDMAGRDTVVALVSDHGMMGTNRRFHVNYVLEQAGLLKRTHDNKIEIAQTKVLAPPNGDFFVVVNTTDRKDGVVPPDQKREIVDAAARALLTARDPQTGLAPVVAVYRPGQMEGLGGPAGGDLYLDLAPGYYPSNSLAQRVAEASRSPIGDGVHGFNPSLRKMHAIFYLHGPGIGARPLPPMKQIDVAPTLLQLMGVPPPPTVRGRVLVEALDR